MTNLLKPHLSQEQTARVGVLTLLLTNKVDLDDRLIVGLAKCPDGLRLANLAGTFHYSTL